MPFQFPQLMYARVDPKGTIRKVIGWVEKTNERQIYLSVFLQTIYGVEETNSPPHPSPITRYNSGFGPPADLVPLNYILADLVPPPLLNIF